MWVLQSGLTEYFWKGCNVSTGKGNKKKPTGGTNDWAGCTEVMEGAALMMEVLINVAGGKRDGRSYGDGCQSGKGDGNTYRRGEV